MNPPLFSLLSRGQGGHKSSKASSAVGSTSSRTGRAYPIINEGYDYLQQTSELLRDNRSALDERLESFSERAARLANAAPRANKLTKGRLRPKEFYDSAQDLLTDVKGAVGPSYKSSSRRRKASSISGTIISNYPETLLSASISDLRPGALAVMDSNRELSRSRSSSGRGHGRGQEAVVPDAKSSPSSSKKHKRSDTVPSRPHSRSSFQQGSSTYPNGEAAYAPNDHSLRKKRAKEDLTRSSPPSDSHHSNSRRLYEERDYERSKHGNRRWQDFEQTYSSGRSHRRRDDRAYDEPYESKRDYTAEEKERRRARDRERMREEERASRRSHRRHRSVDVYSDRDRSRDREATRERTKDKDRRAKDYDDYQYRSRHEPHSRKDRYYDDDRHYEDKYRERDRYHTYTSGVERRPSERRRDPYYESRAAPAPPPVDTTAITYSHSRPRTPDSPAPLPVPPPKIRSEETRPKAPLDLLPPKKQKRSSSLDYRQQPPVAPPAITASQSYQHPPPPSKRRHKRAYSIASDAFSMNAPTYIPYDDVRSTRMSQAFPSFGQQMDYPKHPRESYLPDEENPRKRTTTVAGSIRKWGKLSLWTKGKSKFVENV